MKDGILLVHKPVGMTSREVVNFLMKKLNTRKMGHTGTLDPFAEGLMIVTVNKGTKISSFIEEFDKSYLAELTLGASTDTLDCDGRILEEKKWNFLWTPRKSGLCWNPSREKSSRFLRCIRRLKSTEKNCTKRRVAAKKSRGKRVG